MVLGRIALESDVVLKPFSIKKQPTVGNSVGSNRKRGWLNDLTP